MPVPQGIISTSTGPVEPEVVEEVTELVEEELPEATEENDL